MLHLCPKCKTASLQPLSPNKHGPSPAVPPSRCSTCHGVWMPQGTVSLELKKLKDEPAQPAASTADALARASSPQAPEVNDAKVGFCPAGHGLLIRAKVDADPQFWLDRCGTCAGIWFDAGEWARLASTEWMHHLDKLWDPIWRKRLREERARKQHVQALAQALGEDTAKKVIDLAAALKGNPRRSLAMAYLIDEMKEGEL